MTDDQVPMTNTPTVQREGGRAFDLAGRTAVFGERAIHLARTLRRDAVTIPLISQFVRSATSVGANYVEADEARSKKEFKYRISICRREARETQYWIRMIVAAEPNVNESARSIWVEASELVRIFAAIYRKSVTGPK
jgi:four helix bundle protein